MASHTPYYALHPYPKDGSGTSVEMLHSGPHERVSHESHDEAQNKRKPTFRDRWSHFPWKSFLIVSTLPLALAPIIVLAAAAEAASQNYIRGRACYPNGRWKEELQATWRIMDSTYFFTPNLSFGAMTFTQVKVIDIAWDLVVGRGGQLLCAWVNYRVFNEWIVYHMEMHLTSYKLYSAIAFETTTMSTAGVLGKEFLAFGKLSWNRFFRWLAMLSMLLSTLYVLAFPTLMAAMSGYITTYQPYIEDYDKNLIEWNKVVNLEYVINDASRINFDKPLAVVKDDLPLMQAVSKYLEQLHDSEFDMDGNNQTFEYNWYPDYDIGSSTLIRNVSTEWTFEGNVIKLDSPSLNLTRSDFIFNSPNEDVSELNYVYYILRGSGRQGEIYNRNYLLSHGSCKPSETYQWGFSYIFMFMVSIFQFLWSCTMVGLWLDTRYRSRMYISGRRPGLLRSILDLSAAMQEELGSNPDHMEEEELRKKLTASGGALVVPKGELKIKRTGTHGGESRKRTWRSDVTRGSSF